MLLGIPVEFILVALVGLLSAIGTLLWGVFQKGIEAKVKNVLLTEVKTDVAAVQATVNHIVDSVAEVKEVIASTQTGVAYLTSNGKDIKDRLTVHDNAIEGIRGDIREVRRQAAEHILSDKVTPSVN